jgi:cell division septation protein DedD
MARVGLTLALLPLFWLSQAEFALAQNVDSPAPAKAAAGGKRKAAAKADANGDAKGAKQLDKAGISKALDAAAKALEAGKPDVAVTQTNTVLASSGLDSRSTAQALSLRGQAYRRQSKPAQAIADLQSALWLKGGLSDTERATAMQARSESYREAGLDEPPLAASRSDRTKSASAGSATVATATEAPSSGLSGVGSSVGNFFSNMFGGGGSTEKAATKSETASIPHRAPSEPAVSSWSQSTSVKAAPPRPAATHAEAPAHVGKVVAEPKANKPSTKTAAVAPPAPAVTEADKQNGPFQLQLAAVRSRDEAKALADRVTSENGALVGTRDYEIVDAVFGNMGKFYRVRIGPYADLEQSKSACATLRAKGVDCMIVPQ